MPRIEFESPEQKQRFDSWIGRHIFDGRFVGGSIIPLGSDGRGSLEVYPTKDDAIVVVDEASDFTIRKPVLVTSESFIKELATAGIIFAAVEPLAEEVHTRKEPHIPYYGD
ncbi:MAG: hypothetical protein AAB675_03860 [Patescibacteria group bacterium]